MMEFRGRLKYFLIVTVLVGTVGVSCLEFKYHTHDELAQFLKNFTSFHTNFFSRLYSIGKSVKGKELWVIELSAKREMKQGTPNVKLIGNIHGNEPAGREILLHFLEYLADEYNNNNETIRWLMENTRIHILPSMNPDGFETSTMNTCIGEQGRTNAKFVDLNRNFPDYYKKITFPRQPESTAVQKWMQQVPFVLSASLHSGALVANYPFDTVEELKWEKLLKDLSNVSTEEEELKLRQDYIVSLTNNPPSISPDDDVFVHLAKTYANKHPSMHLGHPCPESNVSFAGGITNGAAWYPFRGGMQDYNYFVHGCMELTLELSCCKYPHFKKLAKIWLENKWALVEFILQANKGVTGQVLDRDTKKPVPYAVLKIVGREMNFTTTKYGEFWRILLPGSYKLEVQAWGYYPKRVHFVVVDYQDALPKLTTVNVFLRNKSAQTKTAETTEVSSSSTVPAQTEASSENSTTTTHKTTTIQNEEEADEEVTIMKIDTLTVTPEIQSNETSDSKTLVKLEGSSISSCAITRSALLLYVVTIFVQIKFLYL